MDAREVTNISIESDGKSCTVRTADGTILGKISKVSWVMTSDTEAQAVVTFNRVPLTYTGPATLVKDQFVSSLN